MDTHPYWRQQIPGTPLFPDVQWNKPERRNLAGKLGIIGGNKLSFASVADSYQTALATGAGHARVLMPDVLKSSIPASLTDVIFAPSNPSGSLSREALPALQALGQWSDLVLMIGDAGRNSETAILYEQFLRAYTGQLVITRDAVDLIKNDAQAIVERPETLLVVSFAQVQKLFQLVYYPKVLTFSMQLSGLVEALHKFTITYPCTIMTLHKDTLIIAHDGEVITQTWQEPMAIWRGTVATRAACYQLWNRAQPLAATATSVA